MEDKKANRKSCHVVFDLYPQEGSTSLLATRAPRENCNMANLPPTIPASPITEADLTKVHTPSVPTVRKIGGDVNGLQEQVNSLRDSLKRAQDELVAKNAAHDGEIADIRKQIAQLNGKDRVSGSHQELHFSNGDSTQAPGGVILATITDAESAGAPIVLTKYTQSAHKVSLSGATFWFESGVLKASGSGDFHVYYIQLPNHPH
jgi:hypothetical protein